MHTRIKEIKISTSCHLSYLYARKIKVLVQFPFSQPPQFNFGNFFIQYGTRCALALNSTMNINLIEKKEEWETSQTESVRKDLLETVSLLRLPNTVSDTFSRV